MKLNKKKILSLTLVILLLAIASFGTLAWFNDTEAVENKFYVASSEDEDSDDIFSVDVYEEVDTDGDGELEKVEEGGAEFKDVLPGETIVKAPYVKNTGRYEQWVRLTLTFSTHDAWLNLHDGYAESPLALLTLADDFADNWLAGEAEETEDAYIYTFYSKVPLESGDVLATFNKVNVPTQLTQQDMFDIQELALNVKADAVQVENLGVNTAKEAFELVENDHPIGG